MKNLNAKRHCGQKGFTLLEMSIVVLVLGVLLGIFVPLLANYQDAQALRETKDKQRKIALALSVYAQAHFKLPCPGAPNGNPLGRVRATCSTVADRDGIVPFRELGLTREDATDGYGNPFTYAVSVAALNSNANAPVYGICRRTGTWWISGQGHIAPDKARFCCPRAQDVNQLLIYDAAGNRVAATQDNTSYTPGYMGDTSCNLNAGGCNGYPGSGGAISPFCCSAPAMDMHDVFRYFAYMLVSHGKNGKGSYTFNVAARKTFTIGTIGTNEAENINNDLKFSDVPYITKRGSTYFDDIVLWRTQETLMNETGDDSCMRP